MADSLSHPLSRHLLSQLYAVYSKNTKMNKRHQRTQSLGGEVINDDIML